MHIKVKHRPIIIKSINMAQERKISDLELFFMVTQELLQNKIKHGCKGKKLSPQYKMTYQRAQGILFDLNTYFGVKGCFSMGICETCKQFDNSSTCSGLMGYCGDQPKLWCDTCDKHSPEGGGFGL